MKIPTHTRRKNGRARRRDAASRCPYSRRRLREAPEEVNELVTREIERRIADGQISRAQCMDTHWDWLKHAVLDAAAEAAPARSGRRPMKPGFDVATLLLRERRKKLLPELKEAESAGRAAEAATLRSMYRKLTKDIKKSSRRAIQFLSVRNWTTSEEFFFRN